MFVWSVHWTCLCQCPTSKERKRCVIVINIVLTFSSERFPHFPLVPPLKQLFSHILGPFNLQDVTIKRISNLKEVPVPTLEVQVNGPCLPSLSFKCWVRIPIRSWIFFFLLLTFVSSLHFSFLRWIHYLPNGLTCFFIRSTHYVDTMTLYMWSDLTPSSASLEEWIFPRSSFALDLTESNDGSWLRCVCCTQNSVFW